MEKLSIEEKAQAYDKALERAQALYNDKNEIGYANAESVLEEVFPLLKESEDERIRKELIKFLQECHNIDSGFFSRYCEIPFAQTLAWLEKQGQKLAWSEEDEHRVKDTIYFLDTAKKHYASTVELDACINWLKSIKERIGGE